MIHSGNCKTDPCRLQRSHNVTAGGCPFMVPVPTPLCSAARCPDNTPEFRIEHRRRRDRAESALNPVRRPVLAVCKFQKLHDPLLSRKQHLSLYQSGVSGNIRDTAQRGSIGYNNGHGKKNGFRIIAGKTTTHQKTAALHSVSEMLSGAGGFYPQCLL